MEPILAPGAMMGAAGAIPSGKSTPEGLRLQKTAQEFEGVFLGILLKAMRGTVASGGLFGDSADAQMYRDMFDQEIAQGLAKAGGIGLAKLVLQDEARRSTAPPSGPPGPEPPETSRVVPPAGTW